jgi:hypothetical protein
VPCRHRTRWPSRCRACPSYLCLSHAVTCFPARDVLVTPSFATSAPGRRSAMSTSSSSVSHSSECASPPWLSSHAAATRRTEPELVVPFIVPKPLELLPGQSPPQRRPSPHHRHRCSQPSPRPSMDGLPRQVMASGSEEETDFRFCTSIVQL